MELHTFLLKDSDPSQAEFQDPSMKQILKPGTLVLTSCCKIQQYQMYNAQGKYLRVCFRQQQIR